jgi:hypothetical protein
MGRFNRVGAPLSMAVLLFFGGKLVHTYGHSPASSKVASADRARPVLGIPVLLSGGQLVPPLGTSSASEWTGTGSDGRLKSVPACNCFESVNYLTSGDKNTCVYRRWPMESITALDDGATWSRLEQSLKFGDVVEFVANVRSPAGVVTPANLHAQMCAGMEEKSGLMIGANNEPRFVLENGVPTPTDRWDACTSHAYYLALRAVDDAWQADGYENSYQIRVYRRP